MFPPTIITPTFIAPTFIAPAILDTVLGRLARLFLTGAGGDLAVACDAARQMLAAYNVETPDELRLAAQVVSCSFHALEALSQATTPDLSLTRILRIRGSAVSLSREAHKAQRKLDQLQRERRAAVPVQPAEAQVETAAPQAEATPTSPQIDQAIGLIEFARDAIENATRNNGQTWTKGFQQRGVAKRIAKRLIKQEAAREAALNITPPDTKPASAQVAAG
jgi:hypothetical protein